MNSPPPSTTSYTLHYRSLQKASASSSSVLDFPLTTTLPPHFQQPSYSPSYSNRSLGIQNSQNLCSLSMPTTIVNDRNLKDPGQSLLKVSLPIVTSNSSFLRPIDPRSSPMDISNDSLNMCSGYQSPNHHRAGNNSSARVSSNLPLEITEYSGRHLPDYSVSNVQSCQPERYDSTPDFGSTTEVLLDFHQFMASNKDDWLNPTNVDQLQWKSNYQRPTKPCQRRPPRGRRDQTRDKPLMKELSYKPGSNSLPVCERFSCDIVSPSSGIRVSSPVRSGLLTSSSPGNFSDHNSSNIMGVHSDVHSTTDALRKKFYNRHDNYLLGGSHSSASNYSIPRTKKTEILTSPWLSNSSSTTVTGSSTVSSERSELSYNCQFISPSISINSSSSVPMTTANNSSFRPLSIPLSSPQTSGAPLAAGDSRDPSREGHVHQGKPRVQMDSEGAMATNNEMTEKIIRKSNAQFESNSIGRSLNDCFYNSINRNSNNNFSSDHTDSRQRKGRTEAQNNKCTYTVPRIEEDNLYAINDEETFIFRKLNSLIKLNKSDSDMSTNSTKQVVPIDMPLESNSITRSVRDKWLEHTESNGYSQSSKDPDKEYLTNKNIFIPTAPRSLNQVAKDSPPNTLEAENSGDEAVEADGNTTRRRHSLDEEDRFVLHLTVLTLYKDQIKPQQIEIKHRLQELHCSSFLEKNFLQLYEELNEWYRVEKTSESNSTVYLRDTPNWFSGWVDMRDTQNPYPLHVWLALDQYISSLLQASSASNAASSNLSDGGPPEGCTTPPGTTASSPMMAVETRGGRYGMSKRLKTNGPEVFRRYSLGQVCHIVQLAVHLGLLSYDGGSLMPAACCRSLVRRLFPPICDSTVEQPENPVASTKVHDTSSGNTSLTQQSTAAEVLEIRTVENDDVGGQYPVVIDLAEIQRNLRILLSEDGEEFTPMLLSQLKFRFLHKFKRRLDPVCFGFTRLSDFLAERCSSSCRLVREGGRQVLVDRVGNSSNLNKKPDEITQSQTLSKINCTENIGQIETESTVLTTIEVNGEGNRQSKHSTTSPNAANWSSVDPNADRTTRGLLAVVAKHNRFHSNISFSFWQFCAEIKRMHDVPEQKKSQLADVTPQTPRSKENDTAGIIQDSEDPIVFSPAARFTDFLFASVLRPAATDIFHTVQPEGTMSNLDDSEQQDCDTTDLSNLPVCSAQSLSVDETTALRPADMACGQLATQPSMAHQLCRLQWFTRRPLVERQLGNKSPLSDEDIEALQDVFFSVLPPRLPLIPSTDSNRAPRPSKLRRQISAQIAHLRREVFSRN